MARGNELQSLVQQFVGQLQEIISKQVESELAGKFDAFRNSIFTGTAVPTARGAGVAGRRRSPLAGRSAELKPCPVCGTPNKARRFSYLCENHRDDESLAKFKGGAKAAPQPVAARKATSAAPAKAAKGAAKRGPGRPKGAKNKKGAKGKGAGKQESSAAPSA